jgi:hypothetical protein
MTLYSQYIHTIILFAVNNRYIFTTNNAVHKHNTRINNNFHPALLNFTKLNKRPCISGIKAYNYLPQYLKALDQNSVHFISALKRFFIITLFTPFMNIKRIHYQAVIILYLICTISVRKLLVFLLHIIVTVDLYIFNWRVWFFDKCFRTCFWCTLLTIVIVIGIVSMYVVFIPVHDIWKVNKIQIKIQ